MSADKDGSPTGKTSVDRSPLTSTPDVNTNSVRPAAETTIHPRAPGRADIRAGVIATTAIAVVRLGVKVRRAAACGPANANDNIANPTVDADRETISVRIIASATTYVIV